MNFETIFLTDDELIQLKKLKQAALVDQAQVVEPENKKCLERLRDLGLAHIQASPCVIPGVPRAKIAFISDHGTNYLAYLEHKRRERRADRRHDWALTLIGAVAGSLLTLLIQHL